MSSLLLKWGTLKGWKLDHDGEVKLLQEYFKDGQSLSCMSDRPDQARKDVLCKLIDVLDGEIQNDWTGEVITKEQAKEYVKQYGMASLPEAAQDHPADEREPSVSGRDAD